MTRFGAPTEAWETKYDYPQLWGTRRIGPDLAREGAIRSADWQLAHLYNPRLTVGRSIMPGFLWTYDRTPDKPKPQALALVAYIQWLGQARAQSGFERMASAEAGRRRRVIAHDSDGVSAADIECQCITCPTDRGHAHVRARVGCRAARD